MLLSLLDDFVLASCCSLNSQSIVFLIAVDAREPYTRSGTALKDIRMRGCSNGAFLASLLTSTSTQHLQHGRGSDPVRRPGQRIRVPRQTGSRFRVFGEQALQRRSYSAPLWRRNNS